MKVHILLLIILAVIIPVKSLARYSSVNLSERIADSDLIVKGSIFAVDELTYSFNIEYILKGNTSANGQIEVLKFKNWTCAYRGEYYSKEQKLILFLKVNPDNPKTYYSIGSGNEGEARIIDNEVYVKDSPGDHFKCMKTKYGKISGVVWELPVFESLIIRSKGLLSYKENNIRSKELLPFERKNVFYNSDQETLTKILESNDYLFISVISQAIIESPKISENFLLGYINRKDCSFYQFASSAILYQNLLSERLSPILLNAIRTCNKDLGVILYSSRMLGELGEKANFSLPELRRLADDSNDETVKMFIEMSAIKPIEKANKPDI